MKEKKESSFEDKVLIPVGILGMIVIIGFVIASIYFKLFVWR